MEVKDFITGCSPQTKIYIGGDSERIKLKDQWVIDYTLAIVVHIDGCHGAKVFGEVQREVDYGFDKKKDRPKMRLMNEVYKIAELYLALADVLEDRDVQVHLDINPNENYGSSCVINEAVGYIRGVCQVEPKVKPQAFAASYCADRLKELLYMQEQVRRMAA